MKDVRFTKQALKDLRKMQPKRAAAIRAKINDLRDGKTVDIKAMQGTTGHRIRIGTDRALVEITDTSIIVTAIGPRGSIYKA